MGEPGAAHPPPAALSDLSSKYGALHTPEAGAKRGAPSLAGLFVQAATKPHKRAPSLGHAAGPVLVSAHDDGLPKKLPPETELVCGEAELWAATRGIGPLIGIDEAGRGPLAGPVVVAACAMPWPCLIAGIDDSKKLTEAERDALYEPIMAQALAMGVAVIGPEVIDEMNILRASLHGMAVAWEVLVKAHPELVSALVLIDGRDLAPLPEGVSQRPLIKGDSRSINIAAASIIAKVTRDRLMVQAHESWPVYGFDRHKGYPTPTHRKAVIEHGPCPIHRRSFGIVAESLAQRAQPV